MVKAKEHFMYRVKEESVHTIEVEKSRFITYLNRVFSEEEAKSYLISVQKMHPNANHHCYAFIIGEQNHIQRSNDNGEPSGTAGSPMLQSLIKHNMQDTIAITVRYFGGIKLGTGGLIRAYSHGVSEALKEAIITQTLKRNRYRINFSYDLIGKIDYFFSQNKIEVIEKLYDEEVSYEYQCEISHESFFAELSSGKSIPIFLLEECLETEIHCPFKT